MGDQGDADISAVARLLAEPARARALMALTDGRVLPAGMLALEAGVAGSTMSGHLARLVDGGLVTVEQHGRYRYYRLAGPQVAELVEVMAKMAPTLTITSLRQGTKAHAIRRARRCYDHLGGRIAVAITGALLRDGHVTGIDDAVGPEPAVGVLDPAACILTDAGADFLRAELGVSVPARTAVRGCVDWTEHRHHVGGVLGRSLLGAFEERGWMRRAAQPRVVTVTDEGRRRLEKAFRIDLADAPRR